MSAEPSSGRTLEDYEARGVTPPVRTFDDAFRVVFGQLKQERLLLRDYERLRAEWLGKQTRT